MPCKTKPIPKHLSRIIVGDLALTAHRSESPDDSGCYQWNVKGPVTDPVFVGDVKAAKRHLDTIANAYLLT